MDEILHSIVKWVNQNDKRCIIGISGHGASGKTTLAHNLMKRLEPIDVNYINTDPYIVDSQLRKSTMIDYQYKNKQHQFKMTACHPAAHHLLALERDLNMVRNGLDLYTIGTNFSKSTLISSQNNINIVEGMCVAFLNPKLFDLTIYLYTDGKTEFLRRSRRDIAERGMDIQYLRQSHEERRIQYEIFMHPQHQYFDIVIKNSNKEVIVEKDKLNLLK